MLSHKGKKIASVFCQLDKLPAPKASIDETIQAIQTSKACRKLSKNKLKYIAYYIKYPPSNKSIKHIKVPSDAKCPVCGMFVAKYPKWTALMIIDGKKLYFDGVKDMMKYYIFDGDFVYNRDLITQMSVSDYYTLKEIDAKDAYYVIDSNIYGPMGNELIPFGDKKSALEFLNEHHGSKVIRFEDISDKIVLKLDGLEYE
jgi:nitrous oxide reductase accessory protein NosL